jgi:hypothetical protein
MGSNSVRIAVVGTGAAAWSVATTLLARKDAKRLHVTVIGSKRNAPPEPPFEKDPRQWTSGERGLANASIRRRTGWVFPPPRSQFGEILTANTSGEGAALYTTRRFGGLSDFWSTAMFPCREDDLAGVPAGERLPPYYQDLADRVGISGDDRLSAFFSPSYVNRPPVRSTALLQKLADGLQDRTVGEWRFAAGANHLAVETRAGRDDACVYCAGCHYGCFRGSLMRPGLELGNLIDAGAVRHHVGWVRSVEPTNGGADVLLESGERLSADLVFLCGGAYGSTEIALRSKDAVGLDVFVDDNEMYNFPILHRGRGVAFEPDHFAISSIVVAMERQAQAASRYGHVLLAPLPSILFDFYLSGPLRALLGGGIRLLRSRFAIAQMYVDSSTAARHALRLEEDGSVSCRAVRTRGSDLAAKEQVRAFKKALEGTGFWAPPFPLSPVPSSFHYVGGLAPSTGLLDAPERAELLPRTFVCDASVFSYSPAQPLTFTIMAHAARVVTEALAS